MGLKENNEITVKIKCNLDELYNILEKKDFKIVDKFSMDDTYFVPNEIDLDKINSREILMQAVLVRDITGKISNRRTKKMTFKIKNFDEYGNILSQSAVNCDILNTDDAKKLLNAIGYQEIMNIKENDIVYEKDGLQLAIKDIENGDNLIEIETTESADLNTIEKLIKKINEIEIPIYTDNYFVKKAEIELDKILRKNK
jgi:adenylate cyclase class IV